MKSDIRVCSAWRGRHDRPVYSLSQTCPECGAPTENSAPAPYNPDDTYGEYRRARKRRAVEESQATHDSQATEE